MAVDHYRPPAPIYIPSKGRWQSRLTMKALDRIGIDYKVIVEEQEFEQYASVIDPKKLLILDPEYQRRYDACDDLGMSKPKGSGPARNFAWDHAEASGAQWHWTVDDNIAEFYRLNNNLKNRLDCAAGFVAMEDFVQRYTNVAMAGPNYEMFAPRKRKCPPFVVNTRIYSCNLTRTTLPYRWRGRFNEDTDLSLRMLKDGWCTILFNAFLQDKITTMKMRGGNTDTIYVDGTLAKSQMIADLHPDVARVTWRFGRWHHYVDYRPFRNQKLIRRPDFIPPDGPDEYGMHLQVRGKNRQEDQPGRAQRG